MVLVPATLPRRHLGSERPVVVQFETAAKNSGGRSCGLVGFGSFAVFLDGGRFQDVVRRLIAAGRKINARSLVVASAWMS